MRQEISRRSVLLGVPAAAAAGLALSACGSSGGNADGYLDPLPLAQRMLAFNTAHNDEEPVTVPYATDMRDLFHAAGADTEVILTPAGQNAHLVARFPSPAPRARPLIFLCHSDTVSVEPERWTHDPFRGTVEGDFLYGRGALDMKGMNAAVMAALLRHARRGTAFDRDLVFLSDTDEESGRYGTTWLTRERPELLEGSAVVTEGGWMIGATDGVNPAVATITVQDKVSLNLELVATGTATHSSKPIPDSAILKLDRAELALDGFQPPVSVTPLTAPHFRAVAESTPDPAFASTLQAILASPDPATREAAAGEAVRLSPYPGLHNALLRSVVTQVIRDAGYRSNVLPGSARALMNLRMIPDGSSATELVAAARARLAAVLVPDVVVNVQSGSSAGGTEEQRLAEVDRRLAQPPGSIDTDVYRNLVSALGATFPGVRVVPGLFEAGTSATPWRSAGVPVYGIYPYTTDNDTLTRMHGNDERVGVAALRRGADLMEGFLTSFALPGAPRSS